MIVTLNQFLNLYSKMTNIHCEGIKSYANEVIKSPNLFENSDIDNTLFSNILDLSITSFNKIYLQIENYILNGDSRGSRLYNIGTLTIMEEIFLSENLGMKDTEYALNNTYSINSRGSGNFTVRLFKINDDNLSFKFLVYGHRNESSESSTIISIFIGNKILENDKIYLDFIYKLAELFIDMNLKDYIPYNRISEDDESIVISNFVSPADAIFVTNYYCSLFRCIIMVTNNSMINSFDSLVDNMSYYTNYIFSSDIMQKIWDLAEKYNSKYNFVPLGLELEVYKIVYSELLRLSRGE